MTRTHCDETQARRIASWWHGGQPSPLYAFASTGSRIDGLMDEVDECLFHACTEEQTTELTVLRNYLTETNTEVKK